MEQGVARSYLFLLIKPSVIYLFFKSFLKLKRNEDSFIRERECMRVMSSGEGWRRSRLPTEKVARCGTQSWTLESMT